MKIQVLGWRTLAKEFCGGSGNTWVWKKAYANYTKL